MFCRLCTIALVLPFLSLSNATRICNNVNATVFADEYFKGFYEEVKNSQNITYEDNLFRKIVRPMFSFVDIANKSCYHDTFSRERDGLEFNKFMDFSITHGFRAFIKDGGVRCITAIKDEITKCVKNIVGIREGANDKYHTLWMTTGMDFGYAKGPCRQVMQLKNCTLSVIRNEGYYNCESSPYVAVYVSSLFELITERCKRLKRITDDKDDICIKSSLTDQSETNITYILGVLLALVTILLAFVVIRDCRSSDTKWKLKELFTLRSRGQTQLQNEVCQEN